MKLEVVIKKQTETFNLVFGFGCFRIFGEKRGINNYNEVITLVMNSFSDMQNLTFDQEDTLKELLLAAAENGDSENASKLNDVKSIMDVLMGQPETMQLIMEEITKSFPQQQPEGKQPASRATRRKQERT